jgi:uncharacterized protein
MCPRNRAPVIAQDGFRSLAGPPLDSARARSYSSVPDREAGVTGRAWQRMLSGRRLDLLDPSPLDVEIEDIAHGLAFVARWNGQTRGDWPFSVAEHSVLVERLYTAAGGDPRWRLAALLHDAPEYVVGDMISPVKHAVGADYRALEDRLSAAIHLRFGLPPVLPAPVKARIKKADRVSAWLEATQLAGFTEAEAGRFFGRPDPGLVSGMTLDPMPPAEGRAAFLARFRALFSG